jgi:hypothetical protein
MAVALLALFVALGGSGYAAVSLNGKNIQNRSIAGKKLRPNTLGGTEINEVKLGLVPRAGNANLLTGLGPDAFLAASGKATDADRLDGEDSASFLRATAKAADADKLDGQDSGAFLSATAKAADADQLDDKDSTAFAPAGGHAEVDTSTGGLTGTRNCENIGVVGPSVTVEVGASGLVAVWAEARILDFGASEARVQLFEPTDLSSCPTILRGNSATNGVFETKGTLPGNDAGTTGAGSVLVFRVSPGVRTFTLRYGGNPNAGFTYGVDFKRLWVQPL